MPRARRGGTETFWRLWGAGAPEVLLLHCSLAHSGAWQGVAERLGRPALAFDAPGHGASGPVDPGRDYGDQALAQAEAFLGAAPLDVVGHSFGAVVALRMALRQPERVRRLVLIEPVLSAAARDRPDFAALNAVFDDFRAAWAAGDAEAATRAFLAAWGTGTDPDALPERQRAALVARIGIIPAEDGALLEDNAGLLAPGRPEGLRAPVLLLEGAASPRIVAAILDGLAARLPGPRRVRVPGAGHMLPITHPDAVAAAIRDFWTGSSARDGSARA